MSGRRPDTARLVACATSRAEEEVPAWVSIAALRELADQAFDEVSGTIVPNPEQYLFWAGIHPTAEAHLLLGNLALTAVPEPTVLVLLIAVGICTLTRRRGSSSINPSPPPDRNCSI